MDSRKYFHISNFKGVVRDYKARTIPDEFASDCMNVIFDNGRIRRRFGINAINGTAFEGPVLAISYYEQVRLGNNYTIVFTAREAYLFDTETGVFRPLSPRYSTGKIACSLVTVSGTSTVFDYTVRTLSYYKMKLGTNDWDVNAITFTGVITSGVIATPSSTGNLYVGMRLTNEDNSIDVYITGINYATSEITVSDLSITVAGSITFSADTSVEYGISAITSEDALTLDAIDTFAGTAANGSPVITGIADTSNLHAGLQVSDGGTRIPANSVILSVDSATQITINHNATSSGAVSCTAGLYIPDSADARVNYVILFGLVGADDGAWQVAFPYLSEIDEKCVVAVNGVGAPQMWKGTGQIADLAFDVAGAYDCVWAKTVGYFGSASFDHTIMGNINDGSVTKPNKLLVSNTANPLKWDVYYELLTSNDQISAIRQLGSRVVIYKTGSISVANFNPAGGATDPLDIEENKIDFIGCPAPNTIESFGTFHIFLGMIRDNVNIYAFNGLSYEEISGEVVKTIRGEINLPYLYRSFAFAIRSRSLYCLFIPTAGSTYPNKAYVYDYLNKSWTIWEFPKSLTAFGFVKQADAPTWAEEDVVGMSWSDIDLRWCDLKYYEQNVYPILGDADGFIYDFRDVHDDDDGTDIDSFFITKDYPLNDPKHTFKLLEVVAGYKGQESGNDIDIAVSVDDGASYSGEVVIEQDQSTERADVQDDDYAETVCNFFEFGKRAMLRIRNIDGSDFDIESLTIGFTDEEGVAR